MTKTLDNKIYDGADTISTFLSIHVPIDNPTHTCIYVPKCVLCNGTEFYDYFSFIADIFITRRISIHRFTDDWCCGRKPFSQPFSLRFSSTAAIERITTQQQNSISIDATRRDILPKLLFISHPCGMASACKTRARNQCLPNSAFHVVSSYPLYSRQGLDLESIFFYDLMKSGPGVCILLSTYD